LGWLTDLCAELVLSNQYDIPLLRELFAFLATFPKITTAVEALEVAHRVITCFHSSLSGEPIRLGDRHELETMKQVVDAYLESQPVDIVAEPTFSLSDFLMPYTAALAFFFSQATNGNAPWYLCEKMWPLAPFECSLFLKDWRLEILNADAFVRNAYPLIRFVVRPDVLAVWCDIVAADDLRDIGQTREVVRRIVSSLFQGPNGLAPALRDRFAGFLATPISTKPPSLEPHPFRTMAFAMTEGDVRQSLVDAYVSDSVADLEAVIQHFQAVIDIDLFKTVPARAQAAVLGFFTSSKVKPFPLNRALGYLRGPWRQVALLRIADDPLLFIQTICDGRKLHKKDLLDFASSVGIIPYPKTLLVDCATRIFYQAESKPRIRNALRLVNVALKAAGDISETVLNALITSLMRRKEQISSIEVSLLLRTLSDFLRSPEPIAKYLTGMLEDWRGCPLLYGNFHIVHLRFFSRIADAAIPGSYAMDEERHMLTVLKTDRPSLFLSGLRQVQTAVTAMNDLRSIRIMQNLCDILLKRFTDFQAVNWAFPVRMQILCRWLTQPIYRSFHQQICDKLIFTLSTCPSFPFFVDYLLWVPAAIRSGMLTTERIGEFDVLSQVRSPAIFNLAFATIREQISANRARKETAAIESCLAFLTSHAAHQSYYSVVYLRRLVGLLVDVHRDALFHFCVSAFKTIRFLPAFLAVCEVVKRVKDPQFVTFLVSAVSQLARCDPHKRALERISTGPLTRDVLELAASADGS
jgi:hypothetical protein